MQFIVTVAALFRRTHFVQANPSDYVWCNTKFGRHQSQRVASVASATLQALSVFGLSRLNVRVLACRRIRRLRGESVHQRGCQDGFELCEGAFLDLANAFLGDPESPAELFEGHRFFVGR